MNLLSLLSLLLYCCCCYCCNNSRYINNSFVLSNEGFFFISTTGERESKRDKTRPRTNAENKKTTATRTMMIMIAGMLFSILCVMDTNRISVQELWSHSSGKMCSQTVVEAQKNAQLFGIPPNPIRFPMSVRIFFLRCLQRLCTSTERSHLHISNFNHFSSGI